MARKRSVNDLTVDELRQLLIDRRRAERSARLEAYRKTGRIIAVEPEPQAPSLSSLRSETTTDGEPVADERPKPRRGFLNSLLIIVEVAAVIGLVVILLNGMNVLRDLNQQVSSALQQPTLTPTPMIMAVVLPSGHLPPTGSDVVQPNEAEIPEHLRPIAASLAALPTPTSSPEHAQRIQIPVIDVDAPIVQGDLDEQLKKGVGQHIGSANPGQNGNMVLSAHNDVYGQIFRHLDKLVPGDEVVVYTNQKSYVYIVEQTQIVGPLDVEVMASTADPIVTLISCYPFMVDTQRIVVTAKLKN